MVARGFDSCRLRLLRVDLLCILRSCIKKTNFTQDFILKQFIILFVYSLNAFDFLWSAGSSENPSPAHVGKILSVGDGVVTVSGLDKGRP